MYEEINDRIEVSGTYKKASFFPRKIAWNKRVYVVDKITLISNLRDGGVKKRLYSVIANGSVFRLLFNRDDETWLLKEVWIE